MNNKEAIARICNHIDVHHIGQYPHILIGEALNKAIDALYLVDSYDQPLDLSELKRMVGQPISLETGELRIPEQVLRSWEILDKFDDTGFYFTHHTQPFKFEDYGVTWLTYYYPSNVHDNSVQPYCDACKPVCYNCVHHKLDSTDSTCTCILCYHYSNYTPASKFCPKCGKKLKEV